MKINSFKIFFIAINSLVLSCSIIGAGHSSPIVYYSLEINDQFEMVWERTDIETDYNDRRSSIVGSPDRIIIASWDQSTISAGVIGLDSVNGDIVWKVSRDANSASIIIQDDILYRGTVGTATVQSYSVQDGKLLWDTRLPWAHSVSDIYSVSGKVFVHTNDSEFFILNDKGEILDNFSEGHRAFLEIDGILYMDDNYAVQALDSSSKTEIWRVDIGKEYRHAPVFDGETIFLRTRYSPAYIYSIDRITGKINWKVSQEILSNLYVSGERVYFMSSDSYLVTLDRNSGSEISKIKFLPAFDLSESHDGYFIAGDPTNNILVVSFGGSTQIIGLKIKKP